MLSYILEMKNECYEEDALKSLIFSSIYYFTCSFINSFKKIKSKFDMHKINKCKLFCKKREK